MTRTRPVAVPALLLLAAAALLPAGVRGQSPAKPYRIGVLNTSLAGNAPMVAGLKTGLAQQGMVEGRELTYVTRFTREKEDALAREADDLVRSKADLIFANGPAATRAAKAATPTIPIVFTVVSDPVAAGLVVAYPDDPASVAAQKKAQEGAAQLGVEILARSARNAADVEQALREPGDGMLPPDLPRLEIPGRMLEASLARKIPAVFPTTLWIRLGALASYGSDQYAEGVQTASLVVRILKGARPQDAPVEGAKKLTFAINRETAKSLGLTVPEDLLRRADQVVE